MNDFGCTGKDKYADYISKDQHFGISMDYPYGWVCRERRDLKSHYTNVIFVETAKDKIFKARFVVTKKEASSMNPASSTIDALAVTLTNARLQLKDAKVESRVLGKLFGVDAWNIVTSFKIPEDINNPLAKIILSKERMFVFKIGTSFYIVRYENNSKNFDCFDKIFLHCVKSLEFKNIPS